MKRLGMVLLLSAFASTGMTAEASPDWSAALRSAFVESKVEPQGGGVTTSVACFDPPEARGERCRKVAILETSTKKRGRIFTPRESRLARYGSPNYLRSEIVVFDCESPQYVLNPYYFSKTGWILMKRVAVEVGGKTLLDEPFNIKSVSRNISDPGVEESTSIVATEEVIAALRDVSKGGATSIRLIGDKGVARVSPEMASKFSVDVADALAIYDTLNAAVAGAPLQSCAESN